MFTFIEKLRKKPLAVRQSVVFLSAIITVMLITIIWFFASLTLLTAPSHEPADMNTEQNIPADGLISPYAE